jgi:hypothetical protein
LYLGTEEEATRYEERTGRDDVRTRIEGVVTVAEESEARGEI